MPQVKTCTRCKCSKPLHEFSQSNSSKDSLQCWCKACWREYRAQLYAADPDRIKRNARDRMRKHRDLHPTYVTEPTIDNKKCLRCGETKLATEFYSDTHNPDGLRRLCIMCSRVVTRASYIVHQEQIRKQARAHYNANIDHERKRVRDYMRKRYEQDPNPLKEINRKWRARNPEVFVSHSHRYRARKEQADGMFTKADIQAMLDQQHGLCVYHQLNPRCHVYLIDGFHRDHILPIRRGGSNWPDNIQLLCQHCNNSKYAKTHEEYLVYLASRYPHLAIFIAKY